MPPSGQKARLANKMQGIFQRGYPLNHLNFEQKGLQIQMAISPFSSCRDLGSRLQISEGNFHRWWNALLVKTRLFFHRWLAGNLASRCWVIGSHKSANPAFPQSTPVLLSPWWVLNPNVIKFKYLPQVLMKKEKKEKAKQHNFGEVMLWLRKGQIEL